MGECNGRALNREGGAFCSDSATINTHIHQHIHSLSLKHGNFIPLTHTYKHTLTYKISVYSNRSHWKMFAHTHTVHTVMHIQKILTCCFPVGYVWQSISWLWWFVCACLKVEKAGSVIMNYLANRCHIVLVVPETSIGLDGLTDLAEKERVV